MVLKVEPIYKALAELRQPDSHVIYFSPQGRRLDQCMASHAAAQLGHVILLCGHYEGVDQRVIDHLVDEEISIGDYVLTNGVLPALVWIDAVVRLLPGVLGDDRSAQEDSFSTGGLDHPHYTRPEVFAGWPVPPVLLSGNHAAIQKWRAEQALEQTRIKRPDLIERFSRQQAQQ
jgi:tRNA (guanine37-N1)-methyltransferase